MAHMTFTKHHDQADAPPVFHADNWHQDTEFHLNALDGRVPGVNFAGQVTVAGAKDQEPKVYDVHGVDADSGMLLTSLSHKAKDDTVYQAPSRAIHISEIDGDRTRLEGEIKVEAHNGKATYKVKGVDGQSRTILASLEDHDLGEGGEVTEGDDAPMLNPYVEHVHNALSDRPQSSHGPEIARLSEDARLVNEQRQADALRRTREIQRANEGSRSGYIPAQKSPVANPDGEPLDEPYGDLQKGPTGPRGGLPGND